MDEEHYDVALICESGHMVNSSSDETPEHNALHCNKCGSKTISSCLSCDAPIRGVYWAGTVTTGDIEVPAYCHGCGSPYPWTQAALESAEELIRFNESLNDKEKDDLVAAIKETTKDTPKAKVAVEKIKHYGKKLGAGTLEALRGILVDFASETVKKSMGL